MKKNKNNSLLNVKKVFKFQPKNNFMNIGETDPTSSTITVTSSTVWLSK